MSSLNNRFGFIYITFTIVLIFLCAITSFRIQTLLDSKFSRIDQIEDFNYLPNGNFLKGASLSFDEVLADLLWIKTIGYFGEHVKGDQDYQWLNRLLEVTTTLDPYYQNPYEFGGIILSWEMGDIDAGIKILQKGMDNVPRNHPRYWYLPFFTGFNYMYYKGDNQTAARYLEQAASFPQSPAYLPLLVARLYANTDDPGMAIPFLEEMLAQTDSPEMQASLEKRIKEVRVKQHIKILSTATKQFQERTGRLPAHLEELLTSGILRALPIEPFGGRYQIMKDGTIESTSDIDSMKLHINKKEPSSAPLIFSQEPK